MGHSPAPPGMLRNPSSSALASDNDLQSAASGSSRASCGKESENKAIASETVNGTDADSQAAERHDNESSNEVEMQDAASPSAGVTDSFKGESVPPERKTLKVNGNSESKPSLMKDGISSTASSKLEKKKTQRAPKYYCPYDLDERDFDENTPLHVAIHARKIECVKLLLEAGANAHKKCDGSAPVHTAISMGAIPAHANFAAECLSLLISPGADLSVKDESLHTPLYLAAICNLPRCGSLILHDPNGLTTLNMRADRSGGRPLHACAKFDVRTHILKTSAGAPTDAACPAMLTRMLLSTPGIEVDPTSTYGRTPLHIAASRGNWAVARLLLQHGANPNAVDQRGYTPGALAAKRGMVVPNDVLPQLGFSTYQQRDLIMDPNSNTLILCHELCSLHRSCPPISRGGMFEETDPPPENVRRLHVLINEDTGILRSDEFQGCAWETEARRAAMADVLKVRSS